MGKLYNLDQTGLSSDNLVEGTLDLSLYPNAFNLVVPIEAPFFRYNLAVTDENDNILIEGMDYDLVLYFREVANKYRAAIFGGFVLKTKTKIKYKIQVLGTKYSIAESTIISKLVDPKLTTPYNIDWQDWFGDKLVTYPINRPTNLDEAIKSDDIINRLNYINDMLIAKGENVNESLDKYKIEIESLIDEVYKTELNSHHLTNSLHGLTLDKIGGLGKYDTAKDSKLVFGRDLNQLSTLMQTIVANKSDYVNKLDILVGKCFGILGGYVEDIDNVSFKNTNVNTAVTFNDTIKFENTINRFVAEATTDDFSCTEINCGYNSLYIVKQDNVMYSPIFNGCFLITEETIDNYLKALIIEKVAVVTKNSDTVLVTGDGTTNNPFLFNIQIPLATTQNEGTYYITHTPASTAPNTAISVKAVYDVYTQAGKKLTLDYTVNGVGFDNNLNIQLTKYDFGLWNVDNTTQINKPVSNSLIVELNNYSDDGHTHILNEITNVPYSSSTVAGLTTITNYKYGGHAVITADCADELNAAVKKLSDTLTNSAPSGLSDTIRIEDNIQRLPYICSSDIVKYEPNTPIVLFNDCSYLMSASNGKIYHIGLNGILNEYSPIAMYQHDTNLVKILVKDNYSFIGLGADGNHYLVYHNGTPDNIKHVDAIKVSRELYNLVYKADGTTYFDDNITYFQINDVLYMLIVTVEDNIISFKLLTGYTSDPELVMFDNIYTCEVDTFDKLIDTGTYINYVNNTKLSLNSFIGNKYVILSGMYFADLFIDNKTSLYTEVKVPLLFKITVTDTVVTITKTDNVRYNIVTVDSDNASLIKTPDVDKLSNIYINANSLHYSESGIGYNKFNGVIATNDTDIVGIYKVTTGASDSLNSNYLLDALDTNTTFESINFDNINNVLMDRIESVTQLYSKYYLYKSNGKYYKYTYNTVDDFNLDGYSGYGPTAVKPSEQTLSVFSKLNDLCYKGDVDLSIGRCSGVCIKSSNLSIYHNYNDSNSGVLGNMQISLASSTTNDMLTVIENNKAKLEWFRNNNFVDGDIEGKLDTNPIYYLLDIDYDKIFIAVYRYNYSNTNGKKKSMFNIFIGNFTVTSNSTYKNDAAIVASSMRLVITDKCVVDNIIDKTEAIPRQTKFISLNSDSYLFILPNSLYRNDVCSSYGIVFEYSITDNITNNVALLSSNCNNNISDIDFIYGSDLVYMPETKDLVKANPIQNGIYYGGDSYNLYKLVNLSVPDGKMLLGAIFNNLHSLTVPAVDTNVSINGKSVVFKKNTMNLASVLTKYFLYYAVSENIVMYTTIEKDDPNYIFVGYVVTDLNKISEVQLMYKYSHMHDCLLRKHIDSPRPHAVEAVYITENNYDIDTTNVLTADNLKPSYYDTGFEENVIVVNTNGSGSVNIFDFNNNIFNFLSASNIDVFTSTSGKTFSRNYLEVYISSEFDWNKMSISIALRKPFIEDGELLISYTDNTFYVTYDSNYEIEILYSYLN